MRAVLGNFGLALVLAMALPRGQDVRSPAGVGLADLSWPAAEAALTPATVVVIPLGAGSLEQGPHLKLGAAEQLARYLGRRVQTTAPVVVAPPLTYHYYPSFADYPGSTSLTRNTARDLTVDVVRSLARSGPRRFYVLNTGISTIAPLSAAAQVLADDGILLGYTDIEGRIAGSRAVLEQHPPTHIAHADEIETSMLLFVDPAVVDMTKAAREDGVGTGPLTRHRDTPGLYSATGTIGDPTVATVEKGRRLIDALVAGALDDIEKLRVAPLPPAKTAAAPPAPRPASRGAAQLMENGCTAGDERSIREIGARFSSAWAEMDADAISRLFTVTGDMRHPDGTIERGRDMIRQDRVDLFKKREYRGSSHALSLNDIRCLGSGQAIADGKWELKLADAPSTAPRAPGSAGAHVFNGWCTLVVSGGGGESWMIEAWRYTVSPPDNGPPGPTILKTPGWPGRGQ